MLYLLVFLLLLAIFFLPGWWVNRTLNYYSNDDPKLAGTGGELARHLIQRFQLPVQVEVTELGDHYDPQSKTVRLSERFFNGRSLSAVAVAAHEVGHAIQDQESYRSLRWRTVLTTFAQKAQKFGVVAYLLIPFIGIILRHPGVVILLLIVGLFNMLIAVVIHFVTLPTEWDASFKKALPILEKGEYLNTQELEIAKKILTAAALTYVAGALASLLNIWRWLAILKR